MAPRKTCSISKLIARVNARNASSTCDPAVRQGWNSLLESVLHEADVYAGFGYLEADRLRANAASSKPGIEFKRYALEGQSGPSPADETVTAAEFFAALDAEIKANHAADPEASGIHEPAGMYRTFPDESRRFYHVHDKLR